MRPDIEPEAAMITSINVVSIVSCFTHIHRAHDWSFKLQSWAKTRPVLNRPQGKYLDFDGLKMACHGKSCHVFSAWIAVWTWTLLLVPGSLCGCFGPQGIQLRRIHLQLHAETICFRTRPKNPAQLFELNAFLSSLVSVG